MTDHSSLTNFFKQPSLNAWQARWTIFLSQYDFEINFNVMGKWDNDYVMLV